MLELWLHWLLMEERIQYSRLCLSTRGVHGNGNSHSHGIPMGKGSSFRLLMGMGMGIVLMGMGIAYFIGEK